MAKKIKTPSAGKFRTFADGVRYVLQQLGTISFLTVFRTTLIILNLMVIIFLYNVVTSQQAVEKIIDSVVENDQEEVSEMNIKDQIDPQIMDNLNRMLYTLGADRTFVIELHNGKRNATKMPFKFYDMTYEEVNEERCIPYISDYYTEVMVSHYKLPYWLADHGVFIGTTDDLAEIDGRFASNLEKDGGKYLGIMLLKNKKTNLGFIGVAYDNEKYIKSPEEIKEKLSLYGRIITPLLDLTIQKKKYKLVQNNDDE